MPPSSRKLATSIIALALATLLRSAHLLHHSPFSAASRGTNASPVAEAQTHARQYDRSKREFIACGENEELAKRCLDVGLEYIASALAFTYDGRESGGMDAAEQHRHLADVEATLAEAMRENGSGSSAFKNGVGNLYFALGIVNRELRSPSRSRHYFQKALEMQPDNREARWQLSQLPPPSLGAQLGRDVAGKSSSHEASEGGRSVLCVICMDETPYIDEFVDYHLGIGFRKIVVYDNTDSNQLAQWGHRRGNDTVHVVHFPGKGVQGHAYLDCAKNAIEGEHGDVAWAAFWDADEFLVMKRHDRVDDLFEEHLDTGALGVNWLLFGPSGHTVYRPLPVTQRFVYREEDANEHVKSAVRLRDMNAKEIPHVHFPTLKGGSQHDTDGRIFEGALNAGGPTDVAVLHHYQTKSYEELLSKRIRGRADLPKRGRRMRREHRERVETANAALKEALLLENDGNVNGDLGTGLTTPIFDDSAWITLKRVAPKYAVYDEFHDAGI